MTSWTEPRKASLGTILVVESDHFLRCASEDFLQDVGFTMLGARNADDAITLLDSRSNVSLVLTSINMPGSMDGVGLANIVRSRWPQIKIMVVSGKGKPSDLPPDSRFLAKPYCVEDMISQVCSLLGVVPHTKNELFCSDFGPRTV